MRHTIGILGIPIDVMNASETLERLEQFIRERRFHQVATANADFLLNAMGDPELRQILCDADMVTPDGMSVVWAARLFGTSLPERVTGADIVPRLAALAARKGYRIYMLGARPDIAQRARDRLLAEHPALQIVGCVSPEVSPLLCMESEPILQDIERTRPDILLVAFGNPKQEKWIHLHRERLQDVPVCMGVGGTFDFLAGETPRAPGFMQRVGLEWLHRLAQEPRRLGRRYAKDLVRFPCLVARQFWAMRSHRRYNQAEFCEVRLADHTALSIRGELCAANLAEFQRLADRALDEPSHLILDLNATAHVDGAALGTLVNLSKRAACRQREIRIIGANSAVHNLLHLTGVDERIRVCSTLESALGSSVPDALEVEMHIGCARAVCRLFGRAGREQVYALEEQLCELPWSVRQLDLDLRAVTFIDCAMLAALRRYRDSSRSAGRQVRIAVSPVVKAALTREKILNQFDLIDVPNIPDVDEIVVQVYGEPQRQAT